MKAYIKFTSPIKEKVAVLKISTQYVTGKAMLKIELKKLEKTYDKIKSMIQDRTYMLKNIMPENYNRIMLHFYKVGNYENTTFSFRHYEQKLKVPAYIIAIMIQKGAKFFSESLKSIR